MKIPRTFQDFCLAALFLLVLAVAAVGFLGMAWIFLIILNV